MKRTQTILTVILSALVCLGACAQQPKLITGDLSVLKSETSLNTRFTYDNMMVGKMNESDYVKKKVEEANKKETGKGDIWLQEWLKDRRAYFEPQFNREFTKYSNKSIDEKTKYVLIIHTVYTEPGFYALLAGGEKARISLEITVVDSTDSNQVIAKISLEDVKEGIYKEPGGNYAVAGRVAAAYAKSGKILGKFIK